MRRKRSSGFFLLKFYNLEHVFGDLDESGSFLSREGEPFERFNVVIENSYRMTSSRLSTTVDKIVENMRIALNSVQIYGREVQESWGVESVLRKGQYVEGGEGYFVRDGMSLFLGQV